MITREESEQLEQIGVNRPSGTVFRMADWVTHASGTDRLIDMLAADWFESKLALVPADASVFTGDLAARLTRTLARSAVAVARKRAHDWEDHAQRLTAASQTTLADGFTDDWAERVASQPVTSGQIIAASLDAQRRVIWRDRLEGFGSELIRCCTPHRYDRPDVYDHDSHRYLARPDHMAHAAVERYEIPAPCRYGGFGRYGQRASVVIPRRLFVASPLDGMRCDETPITCLLTTLVNMPESHRQMLAKRLQVRLRAETRFGWRGHVMTTWRVAKRNANRVKVVRADATSAGGRNVTAWTCATSNLTRTAKRVQEQWEAIEAAIYAAESLVTFPDGTTVTRLDARTVRDSARMVTYPNRQWAQRYALHLATAS